MRSTVRGVLGFAVLALAAAQCGAADLVYVKKDSRRSTRDASLTASRPLAPAQKWWLLGPFENSNNQNFHRALPPEQAIDLNAEYDGAGGKIRWQEVRLPDGRVNSVRRFKRNDDVLCYLYRRVESPEAATVRVSLGSSEGMTLWLNGEQLLSVSESRIAALANQDFVTLHLRPGANDLLIKLPRPGKGGWAFYFEPTLEQRLLVKLDRQLDHDFPPTGEARFYRIEALPLPDGEVLEVGALAFRANGDLFIASRRGDIWLVQNPTAEDVDQIQYKLFARGLHEVLGLSVVGDVLYCVQRPELTALTDTDHDGDADVIRAVSDRFGISGDYHEYAYGPACDAAGNFFLTLNLSLGSGAGSKSAYRGQVLRISPDGSITPWAVGLRSPNGINLSPDGRLFVTDNQGEWIPTCKLQEVRRNEYYGHPGGLRYWPASVDGQTPPVIPPAVWFPFGLSRSASEPVWDTTAGRFGPFAGQCFVGELTNSAITRVALEEVQGRMQGACFPFRRGFACGVNRLTFAPDGSLFVGETNRGWGSLGGQTQGVERVVFTGQSPFEIHSLQVTADGWIARFTEAIDASRAMDEKNYLVESYHYHHWDTYGSPEIGRKQHPFQAEPVDGDPTRVRLRAEQLETGRVYHIRMTGMRNVDGDSLANDDAYYTLNALP